MGKHSSNSYSRHRKSRNHNRYYNHKYKSNSSSSESPKHSKYHSKVSDSRRHKKSKRKHRSSSSSDYSSSKYKRSSHSQHKESHSKKKSRKRSSTSISDSNISNKSYRNNHSSKASVEASYEKSKSPVPPQVPIIAKEVNNDEVVKINDNDIAFEKHVYDVMKRENLMKQIKQEGFLFNIYKPSSEQSEENSGETIDNVPNLSPEIVESLAVEESAFLITNKDRLLNARYKLLTKQERCNNWAKILFTSYKPPNPINEPDE